MVAERLGFVIEYLQYKIPLNNSYLEGWRLDAMFFSCSVSPHCSHHTYIYVPNKQVTMHKGPQIFQGPSQISTFFLLIRLFHVGYKAYICTLGSPPPYQHILEI